MSVVTVGWSASLEGVVRVRYPAGVDLVAWDRFDKAVCVPRAAAVYTYYDCGPELLGRLDDLRRTGYINRVVVRPTRYAPTWMSIPLEGAPQKTLELWRYRTTRELAAHPAVMRLAPYVPHGQAAALADVLVRVFDPRWYLRPDRPDRLATMEAAFGLVPGHDKAPPPSRRLLRHCWVGEAGEPTADPADFFGRRHAALVAGGVPDAVAVRKVGRHFLRALVAAWLHRDSGGDPLFDPARLFDRAAIEAVAAKN